MKVLRVLLVLITLVIVSGKAFSQEMNFGVKTGMNMSNLETSDELFEFFTRYSPHVGIFVRGRIKNIALQPELILSRISASRKHVNDYSNPQSRYTERVNYLSIPVLLKVYFMDFIHVHAGPQFNILRSAEREFDQVFSFQSPPVDVTNEYFASDVSFSAGAGIDMRMGFSAEIRYSPGIQNIYNVVSGEERKYSLIQLSVGWNFLK